MDLPLSDKRPFKTDILSINSFSDNSLFIAKLKLLQCQLKTTFDENGNFPNLLYYSVQFHDIRIQIGNEQR
jgi:hypothetical protein